MITDADIEQLRTEAATAGDALQVQLCIVALAAGMGEIAEIDEDYRADLEQLGVIPEHVGSDVAARDLCIEAIESARAMDDSQAVQS